MSTVEVTVEQLLAGLIGLIVCVLPFVQPEANALLAQTSVAIGLLGVAYLVGAVLDKLFDTVTGGAEQWARLEIAIERKAAPATSASSDPFDISAPGCA